MKMLKSWFGDKYEIKKKKRDPRILGELKEEIVSGC